MILPTEPPTPAPAPPAPAQAVVRPTAVPAARPNSQVPTVSPTAIPATAAPDEDANLVPGQDGDIFFRMSSDWGSAFAGQEVRYTLLLRNTRATDDAALQDVVIRSDLPANLEVLSASADRGGDPQIDGNNVLYELDRLRPGESIELTIVTNIRSGVERGTRIVAQGEVNYNGLNRALRSNIVTVLVQDTAPLATETSVASPTTASTRTVATPSVVVASPTVQPTRPTVQRQLATRMPTSQTAAGGAADTASGDDGGGDDESAPLPDTSSGVPMAGVLLLGMTLLVRTVRLHRAKERL